MFFLFCGDVYYPGRGAENFICLIDSVEAAAVLLNTWPEWARGFTEAWARVEVWDANTQTFTTVLSWQGYEPPYEGWEDKLTEVG